MLLKSPELVNENNSVELRVPVSGISGPEALWFRVDYAHRQLISSRLDAALLALLIPAMYQAKDIRVEGDVSPRLLHNLRYSYQNILCAVSPFLHPVNISVTHSSVQNHVPEGVATGFSGGIDSFCTLSDFLYGEIDNSLKITHLIYNNVGSHGKGGEELFLKRYALLKLVAQRIGLPLVAINSNMDAFYDQLEQLTFQRTHTSRNAAIALLLQSGIRQFFYSSAYSHEQIHLSESHDSAYSDPITLPLTSTETLNMHSAGAGYTRLQKTRKVAQLADSHKSLDICTVSGNGTENCSRCWKCLRTLLTLELLGCLGSYAEVFSISAYRKNRDLYIAEVLISKKPLLQEIRAYMIETSFEIPRKSILYAFFHIPTLINRYKGAKRSIKKKYRRLKKYGTKASVAYHH